MATDVKSLPDFKVIPYESEEQNVSITDSSTSSEVSSSAVDEQAISVKISSSWTYCGPLLTLNPTSLPASFYTWAEATVNGSILNPLFSFLAFVHKFLLTNNLSHYWFTVRASKGSNDFDLPRWHTDDLFFSQTQLNETSSDTVELSPRGRRYLISRQKRSKPKSEPDRKFLNLRLRTPENQGRDASSSALPSATATTDVSRENPQTTDWKIATTLLGPGTLFISPRTSSHARNIQKAIKASVRAENEGHTCLSVGCVGCAMASEKVREQLAEALKDHDIVQARVGECTYLQTGEEEGAVHSEPESHGDRIFVNVIPGKETELMALTGKWGLEYPRAWCVGLPLMWEEDCLRDVSRGESEKRGL